MTPMTCDWPDCLEPPVDALSLEAGMTLTIEGEPFEGDAFHVCRTHAPELGRIAQQALDAAVRRQHARRNFAPGDAEWTETFGQDRD